ncbi:centrosomal protein of 170 kDa [Gracilinanus agilis]|uniref:centrosomal protein of 170 kDa n=1 Tax=Gracilinanus agilis TaxID=191870 RepID=UPI001CFCF92A|nr:centrosomal protein of 170 kDa [Gracilinanus agilis]
MSLTSWFLVSSGGTRHRLPREMIFVGRDDCELMLQSRSVDKQHAVVNYDASADEHLVKDLGSLNGTFVNDVRIPEQTYITLKLEDKLRFGYDTNLFTVVRGEMRVPEEALKHEKFSSQLQLSQKSSEAELSKSASSKNVELKVADATAEVQHKATETLKSEEKSMDLSAMPRGTPLYGQPSWWGDDEADEENAFKPDGKPEEKINDTGASGCSINAKQVEEQSATANEEVLYPFCREPSYFEIPTKEFQQPSQITESTIHEIPTKDIQNSHAAGAGHASFTIEFDDNAPGKVTIRDHVTKFTPDQRHKSKKSSPSGTQDIPGIQTGMMAPENKVADWLAQNNPPRMIWEGTEEDSKSIKSDVPVYLKRLKGNKHDDGTQSDSENAGVHRHCSKRAVLEEHLRHHHSEQKRLHQKAQSVEKHQEQVVTSSARHRAGHGVLHGKLLKQKSEEPSVPFLQASLLRSSGSLGHRPSQEMDKKLKIPSASEKDNDDDQSDKGTYTIELENPNSEEVEARKMIDKVFGVDDGQDYNRPVINENQKDLIKDWALNSAAVVTEEKKTLITSGFLDSEVMEMKSLKSYGMSTYDDLNSRWRRFPTDYASTSEDEFGSNRNSPKHTRLRTSPALKTSRLPSTGTATHTSSSFKHRIKEQEDYIRDWTAHREEIARISQDLALIAREINDVAGEIDSVTSSGTAPSTTVSTAATTPGSAIDTREELVDRVFDESLNFRKIPPLVHSKPSEGNSRPNDSKTQQTETPEHLTITRRRTWSRDEVMGDNLLLSSVFQFSRKIRQSIDKTAGKIRILFKDKDRNWEEIETKLRAESEVPIVKTSSMEISSILQELKRVEKQLQVINVMIDPDGTLEALNNLGFPTAVLPTQPKQKSSPESNHEDPVQNSPICQPETRALRPTDISVSAEFHNVESEADFSIHFNRFNPEGEEEDVTVHE